MKTVVHYKRARERLLHIETEGGIVNIRVGLTSQTGAEVTSIEILPDHGWVTVPPGSNVRLVKEQYEGGQP